MSRAPYGGLPPFEATSDTSEAAADSMAERAPKLRERVLRVLRAYPKGLTSDQLEAIMQLQHQTVSARLRELYLMGQVERRGRRKNQSGRHAEIHFAVRDAG